MSSPTVSVIIPCFNQGRFLEEALQSVLRQTRPPSEVVVVDDGSSDETAEVVRGYRDIIYVRQPNLGLAATRNRGLHTATGEYIVFLDADDRLRPHALEIGLRELTARPSSALVFGRCARIDERGESLPTVPPPPLTADVYAAFLQRNYIWTPAVAMFRRSLCAPIMRFDSGVDAAADYELYLRIARELPIHGHDQVVADYRLHGGCMSRDGALMLGTTLSVLRAQRPYVSARQEYRSAYRNGVRQWRRYYGEQLVDDMRRQARSPRRWRELAAALSRVARYYPQGLVVHAGRKLRRLVAPGEAGAEESSAGVGGSRA